uniref:Uncharacterized protein n=1 Tax=Tetranychus urticae TaxID=32264 RepID=T1KU31_TETUR
MINIPVDVLTTTASWRRFTKPVYFISRNLNLDWKRTCLEEAAHISSGCKSRHTSEKQEEKDKY